MSRMVDAAMSVEPQAERTDASAVRALVDVIKKEEVTIVVNEAHVFSCCILLPLHPCVWEACHG